MTLGEKISNLRKEKGLSVKDLAEMCEVCPSSISHYEKGKQEPSFFVMSCIATALGASLDYFAGDNNKKPIVHCSKCQYSFEGHDNKMRCDLLRAVVLPDDYCSFGEFKEADEDAEE